MRGIKFLGAGGSVSSKSHTTCIQISDNTLIDAGNIMHALGEKAKCIKNIFLSHSHLDHIVDIGFLLDNFFEKREETLRVYGLKETISVIKQHIYNNDIWPDFTQLNIPNSTKPSLEFITIETDKKYTVEEGIILTPFSSVHTVACCGYIIEKDENAILFSGDTFQNKKLWEHVNSNKNIKAVIIDVSFPNKLAKVARQSLHLTPKYLQEDLHHLKRDDVKLYVDHLKPMYKNELIQELSHIGVDKEYIVEDGDIILYQDGKKIKGFDDIYSKINKLNTIGVALSSEQNLDKLLENIVTLAKEITHADGGTLYMLDKEHLLFRVVQTDSLGIKMGGESGEITWPPLPLYLPDGTPNKKMVAVMCALEGKIINIKDVYEAKGFSFDGTKKFDASTGYRSQSMLVIPLRDHENKIIGVLQLINKQEFLSDKIISFSKDDENTTLSLASQAAVAITKVRLIAGLETLLEAFLKSIIYAIGKKSPYTAGHIKRMVKLSLMIANKVNEDTQEFKEKHYSKEELQEINFSALMHDIGKLATPEQVVDKATKLETIYDRIHTIKSRIELMKKEYEIAFLKQEMTQEEYEKIVRELDEYFEIIQKSNFG